MKIAGLQRVTLLDYPGRIAASVFLAGCNLDCGYCHNRWMIDENAVTPAMSPVALVEWLRTRQGLIDGVCVSGGEPTMHDGLADLLADIKVLGFDVKLDTNGTQPDRLGALLGAGLVDYVALDIKAPLDARYARVAGRVLDMDALRRSMAILRQWDATAQRYEFRTTAGPQLDREALFDIAEEILSHERWYLQRFLATETVRANLRCLDGLSEAALSEVADELRSGLPAIAVRGTQTQPAER
jgi:pyruvate formate lyase activating enzyme